MQGNPSFSKQINNYYLEIQATKSEIDKCCEIYFLLVEFDRQRYYRLNLNNNNLPKQVKLIFKDTNALYQYLEETKDKNTIDLRPQGQIIIRKQQFCKDEKIIKEVRLKASENDYKDMTQNSSCTSQLYQSSDLMDLASPRCKSKNKFAIRKVEQPAKRNVEQICQLAQKMYYQGKDELFMGRALNLSLKTVDKMINQIRKYGKIVPPNRWGNGINDNLSRLDRKVQNRNDFVQKSNASCNAKMLAEKPRRRITPFGAVTNTRMMGQNLAKIKDLLYNIVKEGKLLSFEEIQTYLVAELNMHRSLSSIYRYVTDIKASNRQFSGRNYTMHKKSINEPQNPETVNNNQQQKDYPQTIQHQ